jgi:tRNA 2-thiouridine synthesizing protein A
MEDIVDAVGLICPLPVLRLRKRLMALAPGDVLRIRADDPVAVIDIPHFCHEAGHEFLGMREVGGVAEFTVRRGAGRPEG